MATDNFDVRAWIDRAQMDFDSAKTLAETKYRPPLEIVLEFTKSSL